MSSVRNRDVVGAKNATKPDYPQRKHFDPGRRRFLRQVGTTAGGVGFVASLGLPTLSHGQSVDVDFSILDAHPLRPVEQPVVDPVMSSMVAPSTPVDQVGAFAAPVEVNNPEDGTDPLEPGLIGGDPDEDAVIEDRALWIEPGYLVLMRIARDAEDVTVGEDVDASSETVATYITENLSEYDVLHNIDSLHTHENGIAGIIDGLIEPAHIISLHLDHDCNEICGGGVPEWEDFTMGGIVAPPGPY